MSAFDKIYRSALPMKFFSRGWGNPDILLGLIENMRVVTDRNKFNRVYKNDTEIVIDKRTERKRVVLLEGSFLSPLRKVIPGALCNGNKVARFQMILPKDWTTNIKPVCVHFAGTGDHTYSRRRIFLANQLLGDGIASIIIMNPFYWKRKPDDQRGSSLNFVSDLFVMGGALIMECYSLLKWCESNGYGPIALHGISMGGYMATLCASVWPKPISLIPCLSWTTASVVFVEGILANAVDWDVLSKQYFSDSVYSEIIRPLIQPPISHSSLKVDDNVDSHLVSTNENILLKKSDIRPPNVTVETSNSFLSITNIYDHTMNFFNNQSRTVGKQYAERPGIDLSKNDISSDLSSKTKLQNSSPNTLFFQHLPLVLRNPLDNGISLIRSLPDSLTTAHSCTDPEVKEFLRDLMDFFTHIGNFSRVVDSRLLLSVTAEYDAYVPKKGVCSLTAIYPDAQIRSLPQSGHVGAYLRNAIWTKDFRQAITDCLNLHVQLHYKNSGNLGLPRVASNQDLKPNSR